MGIEPSVPGFDEAESRKFNKREILRALEDPNLNLGLWLQVVNVLHRNATEDELYEDLKHVEDSEELRVAAATLREVAVKQPYFTEQVLLKALDNPYPKDGNRGVSPEM